MRTYQSLVLLTFVGTAAIVSSSCGGPTEVACSADKDCGEGKVCADGKCADTTSRDAGRVPCTPNTVCRTAAGQCDVSELCGADGFCPEDKLLVGTVCRAPAGPCDFEERCDGVHPECPADELAGASTVCRSAAGGCDLAETCTGDDPQCPPDELAMAGTVCRPKAGDCDVEEICAGGTAACPADEVLPKDTECRASAGDCDPAEKCTGDTGVCPPDMKEPATKECRAAVNACDLAELCDGTSDACPADQFEAANTPCSMASCMNGVATAAGYCMGGAAVCNTGTPVSCNGFQCNGTTCGTSCSSSSDCLSTHYCQAGANLCAPKKQDGQPCTSGSAGDECSTGACRASYVDADGDGAGTGPAAFYCGINPPAGRSFTNNDCCDSDARAKPGQTQFFTTARLGCGGFDFDCNGSQTPQYVGSNTCHATGGCTAGTLECNDVGSTGWYYAQPACGASSTYVTSCSAQITCGFSCPGCTTCNAITSARTQGCR